MGRAGVLSPGLSAPSALQYEPIVTEGNEALVHHMEVFQCAAELESVPRFSGPCDSKMKPARLNHCRHVLAAWALGAKVRARSPAAPVPPPPCPPLLCWRGPEKGCRRVCRGPPSCPALPVSHWPLEPQRLFPASVAFL